MASWYSNILTTTTSRISNLRSTLLGGDQDGDTEDDTHVCRVLRAYYTEKGRSFPQWLPPDPKAPPPPVATVVPTGPGIGSRYGGAGLAGAAQQPSALSSLWDSGGSNSAPPGVGGSGGSLRQTARVGGPQSRLSPFTNRNSDPPMQDYQSGGGGGSGVRPLPSQRMGSYQSSHSAAGALDRNSGGGGAPTGSAQDKLRNLFSSGGSSTGGSRSNSPAQYGGSGGGGGGAQYGRGGAGAPGGGNYGASQGGGGGGGRPFVAANAPWASDEHEYSQYGSGGSGGGRSGGSGRPTGGLPSGPRRAGGGLPSGPRMR
ncbi:hypothetical protein SCUCBS95973_008640 [Sporothrix curviconia]|uniref:Mso1 N-terminal domain-containing protein n=1 Tax=Sporothrix curviconia TaxID=1260050 RepID=A0ABP0CNM1_9PEZI